MSGISLLIKTAAGAEMPPHQEGCRGVKMRGNGGSPAWQARAAARPRLTARVSVLPIVSSVLMDARHILAMSCVSMYAVRVVSLVPHTDCSCEGDEHAQKQRWSQGAVAAWCRERRAT